MLETEIDAASFPNAIGKEALQKAMAEVIEMKKKRKMVGQDLMEKLEREEAAFDPDMYYEEWRDEEMAAEG